MQSFPELTRSPDALQANLWFFSAFPALAITEIRKPRPQSSGHRPREIGAAVVDEEMQFADCEKERCRCACGKAGVSSGTGYHLEMPHPAVDEQICTEVFNQVLPWALAFGSDRQFAGTIDEALRRSANWGRPVELDLAWYQIEGSPSAREFTGSVSAMVNRHPAGGAPRQRRAPH